ncbi:MAG: hypothetical protein RLZZ303_2464 [Candidatus Hydrogenedentota bacterium]|jgi:hypothetical protein
MCRWLLALMALSLTGCMAEVLTATAVQGQLQAQQLKGMKRQIEHAQGFSAETELRQAIQAYQGERGVNPPSLEALVPEYLARIPAKPDGSLYGYDPASGRLLDQPLPATPAAPSAEDWRKLDQLRAAIQQYGADTTWYPATLADLVPKYLPEYPRASDGREFLYDNQTGQVYAPGVAPAPVPVHPAPAGGGSVAHEAVGAIGMQQQLNNMNQGGTSAAGNRGRDAAHGVGAEHSDRQMKAIQDLGL